MVYFDTIIFSSIVNQLNSFFNYLLVRIMKKSLI